MTEDDKHTGSGARIASRRPRDGFAEAWEKRPGRKVRFEVGEAALTIDTELREDAEASGEVRSYVLQAGTTTRTGAGGTQCLVLNLTRDIYDEEGNRSPLKTNADQPRPDR